MKTCVLLPTRNEVLSIQEVITRVKALGYDIIVVDENSKDGTIEIAERNNVPVYQRKGLGKGCGVQTALKITHQKGYDLMVIMDCDCTYPPEYIPHLLKFIPKYDMVVGKRNVENIIWPHRLPNLFHTRLMNLLYLSNLKDVNSGMRIIKIEKFLNKLDAKQFDIEAQITTTALKNKLKIKEIPIEYKKRKGESKIRIKDGFIITWRIIIERFRK
ncbi:MAG: glycosyltransferase family 2 protein [Candidatus Margulisbacteria bacterium]|nr:glycosyltransferase family 2 protein [Candidatus Margulisiibacteriota bacterium]